MKVRPQDAKVVARRLVLHAHFAGRRLIQRQGKCGLLTRRKIPPDLPDSGSPSLIAHFYGEESRHGGSVCGIQRQRSVALPVARRNRNFHLRPLARLEPYFQRVPSAGPAFFDPLYARSAGFDGGHLLL